jgi:chromosome segregation protein
LEAAITRSEQQITEETATHEQMRGELQTLQAEVAAQRATFEEKKAALDRLRQEYQQKQRVQFDAEKKVAIAEVIWMKGQS